MTNEKRKKPKRRKGAELLSRDVIVEAALALIDAEGVENFSLREVARTLGVFPTAVYWHIKGGKNELLAAVAGRALQGVTPRLDIGTHWKNWLALLFHQYRAALSKHPNVAPVLGAQLVSNAGVSPILVERILTVLHGAGFRDHALRDAYNAVLAALLGYVTLEFAPLPAEDPERWAQGLEKELRALPADHYPHIHANIDVLLNRAFVLRWKSGKDVPLGGGFELFVDSFLVGLEARLPRPDRAGIASRTASSKA